ncbi:MAG: DNA-binding protein [Prevotella sp.]|nr:DNA-binding protein [Prevotella sp.]
MKKSNSNSSSKAGNQDCKFVAVKVEILVRLVEAINMLAEKVNDMQAHEGGRAWVYTNKSLKETLGVEDKLLRKYREDGLLAFSKEGDKYWYKSQDVEQFLSHNYVPAYAIAR